MAAKAQPAQQHVEEEQQPSFEELVAQMQILQQQMKDKSQKKINSIKKELNTLSQVTGQDWYEMLGLEKPKAQPAPAAVVTPRSSTRRNNSNSEETDEDRKKREIKENFAGQVILNPGVGKDYTVGSRGAFPVWVLDSYDDLLAGKLDAMPRDEYLARGNQQSEEEQPGKGENAAI